MRSTIGIALTLAVAGGLTYHTNVLARMSDWSRFRGPNGTGVSDTTGLPTTFGPADNVVWKVPVPPGHSSPVLSRTHLFLTGHDADRLFVLEFDRA